MPHIHLEENFLIIIPKALMMNCGAYSEEVFILLKKFLKL
jgi:ABC-type arginine/histidine transport system permease subunit